MTTMVRPAKTAKSLAKRHDAALRALRNEIDRLDAEMLRLMTRRARLALQVGQVKKRDGRRVFDPERERRVLQRMAGANHGPLSATAIERIYREIIRQHRRLAQLAIIKR